MRNFVGNLHSQWKEFANYMGYTEDEVRCIREASRHDQDEQTHEFLKLWNMPDCGDRTVLILEEVKKRAGIVDTPSDFGM